MDKYVSFKIAESFRRQTNESTYWELVLLLESQTLQVVLTVAEGQ